LRTEEVSTIGATHIQVRPRARASEKIASGILVALLLLLVAYPLASLLYGSFNAISPDRTGTAFSTANFAKIFSDPQFWLAWRNTILVSLGSAAIALTCGIVAAILIVRTDLPARGVFETLLIVPIFVSPFIGAVAWSGLGAPRVGLLNRMFAELGVPIELNIYSLPGIAMVLGFYMTPYVFLFTSGPLASIDAAMEEASRLSGQGASQTLMRVTLPLVTPSILAAGMLVFVLSMENFGVLAVLGLPSQIAFIPTEIYLKFTYPPPDYAYATVVSVTLIIATALALFAQQRLLARKSYVAIGGKSYRLVLMRLGKWRWPAAALLGVFLLLSTVLPLSAMVLASFQSYWTSQFTAFTLANYESVFSRGLLFSAAKNSFFLAFVGAFVACALAGAVAYIINRTRAPGRGLLDLLSSISVAVPGVVLGVALLWAWIRIPLPIYGTIWILLIAYVTRFLSFGVRNIAAALTQIGDDLENAARVSGASKTMAALTVTFPLVRSSFASSWVLYFISFIKELNTSVLLYSFNSVVLPVIIFDAYLEGRYPQVAALATGISVLIFLVLMLSSIILGIKIRPKA
jgi:iron(III) transport system permease protein